MCDETARKSYFFFLINLLGLSFSQKKKNALLKELVKVLAVGETSTANTDVFEETEILDLVAAAALVILGGRLVVVGLDAADVVGRALGQGSNKLIARGLDLGAGRCGLLLGVTINLVGEEREQELVGRHLDCLDQVKHLIILLIIINPE